MSTVVFSTLVGVIGVWALAFLGIVFFLFDAKVVHRVLLPIVSFSTGALFGDVFLHIIPEMSEGPLDLTAGFVILLIGILFSFIVEKFILWRHCHHLPDDGERDHGHEHVHSLGVMSILGDALHNLIDGIIIASAFLAGPTIGISTTIAVIFHEIPHEIGNFAVLLHSGMDRKRALLVNVLVECAGIVGAVVVLFASQWLTGLTGVLLPFAAGNLLYIAGSDLIPELHKQTRLGQGLVQLLMMMAGMGVMYAILLLE